jgi:hypothetical protein
MLAIRFVFANWLAHVEVPEERQRKAAVRASFESAGIRSTVFFYGSGTAAPALARRVAPEVLANWRFTALDAKRVLCLWPWPSLGSQERAEYRALKVLWAEELYRREHGRSPTSEEDLVGPYLKSLPDDSMVNLDYGTALLVEDPRLSVPLDGPK